MFKAFFWSRRWALWAYGFGALLLTSLYFQVHMSVLLNVWYGAFYDMLQNLGKHTVEEYWASLIQFGKLACGAMIFAVLTYGGTRFYAFAWREAIFMDYLPYWAATGRPLEGECQRLQEDPMQFASIMDSLGIQVAKAFMVLFSFLPILWGLSTGVHITVLERIPDGLTIISMALGLVGAVGVVAVSRIKRRFDTWRASAVFLAFVMKTLLWVGVVGAITWLLTHGLTIGSLTLPPLKEVSGSLVWVALLVTLGGLVISWYVGSKLPGLEYNNQKVEAALRTQLEISVKDRAKAAAVPTIIELFTGIRTNYRRLFLHYGYFDAWSNSFAQALVILPYLIMGDALFSGAITLGVLIQVGNAFDKVQTSFAVFLDNWVTINKLRSIYKRLSEFERNMDGYRMRA